MTRHHPLDGKRVLLTTSHTDVGSGGSMQMFLLAKGLCAVGATVDVLFKKSKADRMPKLDIYESIDARVDFFRPNRWWNPIEISGMRSRIKKGRYDIIHTHKGGDLSLVLLASAGIDVPVLVNQRGVNFPLGLNRFKYNFEKLDRVVVVSQESQKVMIDCGVHPEKIEVIYGGVDVERFKPGGDGDKIRCEFDLPSDAPLFVVVANLVRQKGHEDYLQAAAQLEKTHPGCYHLFAGSGDPSALSSYASGLGIDKQIIFAGFRSDVPDLFAACTASVFPGFAGEGVSGVLRESLACGAPVITTDVGGNAEIIVHGKYGLVVPKRNPDALAGAMALLMDKPEQAQSLADEGRKFVLENHSEQARNQRVFDLYLQIARQKKIDF